MAFKKNKILENYVKEMTHINTFPLPFCTKLKKVNVFNKNYR
jgi:hypothetical protein